MILLLGLCFHVVSVAVMAPFMLSAPEGYQDGTGYHPGQEPQS